MIEKLHSHPVYTNDGLGIAGFMVPSSSEIIDKLNEIIDVVNSFEVTPDKDSTNKDTIVPINFIILSNNCKQRIIQHCEDSQWKVDDFCKLSGEKRKICRPAICPLICKGKGVEE